MTAWTTSKRVVLDVGWSVESHSKHLIINEHFAGAPLALSQTAQHLLFLPLRNISGIDHTLFLVLHILTQLPNCFISGYFFEADNRDEGGQTENNKPSKSISPRPQATSVYNAKLQPRSKIDLVQRLNPRLRGPSFSLHCSLFGPSFSLRTTSVCSYMRGRMQPDAPRPHLRLAVDSS
jgi:hypothetical protein